MRTLAIWSALLGYALLLAVVIGGGLAWPGYDHLRQYISELGANGAPHGRLVSLFGFIPAGLLLSVFAITAFLALPRSAFSLIGFGLVGLFAAGLWLAGIYPCELGCVPQEMTQAQLLHDIFGLAGYMTAPIALALLGIASRRWEGSEILFPLGCVCAITSAAALPFIAPEFALHGAAQRALEGAMALWVLACAAYLARRSTIRT